MYHEKLCLIDNSTGVWRSPNIKTMEDNSEKSTTTTSQDTKSQSSKDKFVKAGQSSLTGVRLRASDGTADVSIGIAPKTLRSLPTDIKPPSVAASAASAASPSVAATIQASGGSRAFSRRSSGQSLGSEASAKSRSVLSGGEAGEKVPSLEGNVQFVGGFECGDRVISVLHSPDGNAIMGGLMNGSIKVFSAITGNLAGVLENEESLTEAMPISRIKCKPNSGGDNPILAATYVSGHLRLWNYANGQCISSAQDKEKKSEYLCLSYNPFVDVIAVGLDNGHIKLYDEKTMQVTSLLKKSLSFTKVDGHTDRVFCITNHPLNPHEFISSGWDNTLQVWDVRSPHAVRSIYGVFVCGEGLAFDRRGKEIMVAHWRPWRNLQFLDYATGGILNEAEMDANNPHYLTCAQYIGKEHVVVGGTDRSLVKVFERHNLNLVATIKDVGPVYDLDVLSRTQLTGSKFVITSRLNILNVDFNK